MKDLGTLELRNVTTVGRVQILAFDAAQTGHIEVDNLDIVSADAVAETDRPRGFGVSVVQGGFTLWNMQPDAKSVLSANLRGLSAGREGKPVFGSGIFVSGAGETGGRVEVQNLEVGSVFSNARIAPGTPDTISGGVFTGMGVKANVVHVQGQVITYGPNDMALDNWGIVDRWLSDGKVTTFGPSGIGFVAFGTIRELKLNAPVETFGGGARGFNVYDGAVKSAEFDRIVTHADGAVGVQISRSVDRLTVHRGIETFGGVGPSLVKGVVTNLPAIALSIKPGGHVRDLNITGGVRTNAKGILPFEQFGIIDSMKVEGGIANTTDVEE